MARIAKLASASAAASGAGVVQLPLRMFDRELREDRLLQPFPTGIRLGRLPRTLRTYPHLAG